MKTLIVLLILHIPLFCQGQMLEGPQMKSVVFENNFPETLEKYISNKDIFSLQIENLEAEQGVKYLFPTSKILFNNLKLIPELAENFTKSAINWQNDLTTLSHYTFRLTGNIAGGFGPPLAGVPPTEIFIQSPEQLNSHIQNLKNNIALRFHTEKDETNWNILPFEFKSALVKFLLATEQTETIFENFTQPVKSILPDSISFSTVQIFNFLISPWQNRQIKDFKIIESLDKTDFVQLAFATRIINENLRSLIRFENLVNANFAGTFISTKYGNIAILGMQNDTLKTDCFVSIDFGGNDIYLNNCGSNSPIKNNISLLIDYAGDDIYKSKSGFVNSGILGSSWLFDFDGNDEYYNSKPGLAFSLFGYSVLYDFSGDDKYHSISAFSQGAAIAGVAVLLDKSGNDNYYCTNNSQGFGGTFGCGLLLDALGNDLYKGAAPDEKKITASFIQGASRGRWAEASDGQNLAGGFGIFIDTEGTDEYFAGSFSQGAGYYFGTGLFNDISGDDKYNAVSHSQGYAAHFALGNFCDFSGNDDYNSNSDKTKITQIMGCGRDNSCALFSDLKGIDNYTFGNRSVGIGDMRGVGCFFDAEEKNTFNWIQNEFNKNSPSIGNYISTNSAFNQFRLFNNQINWNAGMVLLKGSNNLFQKIEKDKIKAFTIEEKLESDKQNKTMQLLKIE